MRFPGFEGEWRLYKLGDITEIKTGSKDTQNKVEGGTYPFFVRSNTIERIDTYSYDGEAILTSGDGAGVGKIFHYVNGKFDFHQRVYAIRKFKPIINGRFLYNLFSYKFYDRVIRLSAKNSVDSVRMDMIADMELYFPSLDEQNHVSNFLAKIDERIEQLNKLIKELTISKLSISENIFEGKIKTSNSTEKWENVQLKEVLNIPEKIKANTFDRNKLLTVKLHLKGVCKNENAETLSEGATNYFIRKRGQFIYGKQNLFNGAFGIIPDEFDGYLSSADVPTLDINVSKVNPLFLLHFLGRERFYKKLEEVASGSGSKRIHETTLLNTSIPLPSLNIQNKIADILNTLDKKINIEKAILTQLEKQKKYLLQNLFV